MPYLLKIFFAQKTGEAENLYKRVSTFMEEELDRHTFFRANRQHIINIGFVKSFKPCENVKLLVETSIPDINHSIIISQETAPKFRKWMQDA